MKYPLLLGLPLMMTPLLALGPGRATATATCSVRICPAAAADYDPSSEVLLRGCIAERQGNTLRLRLPFGTVRVDLGSASIEAARVGQNVEVLASKRQDEKGQRFVARELRFADATQILRDAQGVPL